jgi:hypothetical protein
MIFKAEYGMVRSNKDIKYAMNHINTIVWITITKLFKHQNGEYSKVFTYKLSFFQPNANPSLFYISWTRLGC